MSEENQVAEVKEKQLPIKLGITNAALTKLEKEYKEVPDAATKEGYVKHKEAKKKLTSLRTGVEAERKLQVAEAVLHQKRVNKVANQITTRIVAIETPWYKAKKLVDDAAAEKKRQDALKEKNRILDIEDLISDIRALTANLLGADAETIEERLTEADEIKITDKEYMEFVEQASTALSEVKDQLRSGIESAKALAVQQKEIDDRKTEQDKRDALAGVKDKILEIKMVPVEMMGCTVIEMDNSISELALIEVDTTGELAEEILTAICNAKAKLEAMINQQKNLDDQQKILDEKQQKLDDDAAAEKQRKDDEQKKIDDKKAAKTKEKELLARMPEDIKVRTWMDSIITLEVPDVVDPQLLIVVRNAGLILEDLNRMVYSRTQSPVDEDGDKVA